MIIDILMNFKLNSKYGQNLHYLTAMEKFSKLAMVSTYDVRGRFDWIFPFTRLCREEQKHLDVLRGFTKVIVDTRRVQRNRGEIKKEDECVMDYYMQVKLADELLTDENIREEMDTMLLGSHDTTRSTLGFLLYILAKHPEIQQKVYEEAVAVLGNDKKKNLVDTEISLLPYADCVIKETLRMFPPFVFIGRKLRSEITTGGYTFPKDIEVIFSPYLIGRNPKYFEDPMTFNPERFMGVEPMPQAYCPFSIGAKKCIGGKFAILGLKIVLAKFIRNMKLSIPKGYEDLTLSCELVLKPRDDVPIIIEVRKE